MQSGISFVQPVPSPNAVQSTRVVLTFDCDVSLAVGDIVRQDDTLDDKVVTCTDNTNVKPAIGVAINKPTTTSVEVLTLGVDDGYSGLTIGGKVFLATDGTYTQTKPATGYLQTLGLAAASDRIFFLPNATRVLQT